MNWNKEFIISIHERLIEATGGIHGILDADRIAMHLFALFPRFHNRVNAPANDEVVRVGFAVAAGKMTYLELVSWVRTMTDSI